MSSDSLARHRTWIQRLARSLVLDEARADEVVQGVFLAALRQRPKEDRDLRPWLAAVARQVAANLSRSEVRRARHERSASTREKSIPPIDPASQGEISAYLDTLVGRLEEPYRSTVRKHFFEGLSLEEIARRERIPGATVRTHLRRALEQLRTRLDERYADRHLWCLTLLPLASSPSSAGVAAPAAVAPAVAAGAKTGLLAAAALVTVSSATWLTLRSAPAIPNGSAAVGAFSPPDVPSADPIDAPSGARGSGTPTGDADSLASVDPEPSSIPPSIPTPGRSRLQLRFPEGENETSARTPQLVKSLKKLDRRIPAIHPKPKEKDEFGGGN